MAKKGSLNDHHSFLFDGFEPFPFGKDVSAQEICATDITKCFESNIQFDITLWTKRTVVLRTPFLTLLVALIWRYYNRAYCMEYEKRVYNKW